MGEITMLEIAKESAVTALEFVLGQTSVTLFSRAQAMDIIDSLYSRKLRYYSRKLSRYSRKLRYQQPLAFGKTAHLTTIAGSKHILKSLFWFRIYSSSHGSRSGSGDSYDQAPAVDDRVAQFMTRV
jgi:hypothetical protein